MGGSELRSKDGQATERSEVTAAARTAPGQGTEADWDMTPYFPEFDGESYREFRRRLESDIASLLREALQLGQLLDENLEAWTELLTRLEDVTSRGSHLASYLGCLGAADSRDEAVQRETASAVATRAELEKSFVQIRAAFREAKGLLFERLVSGPQLHEVRYFLERTRQRAEWSMSSELETLTSELDVDGLSAWGRLYNQVSGKLEFDLEVPGRETRRLPVSVTRGLLEDPDPAVRKAALDGSNAAWERSADVMAACLNAISGTRHTLYRRRGIDHFLEPALFDAGISRRTLDALLETVIARQELPRAYLRRKARILGRERLGFQDLMAPLPLQSHARIPWQEASRRPPSIGPGSTTAHEPASGPEASARRRR